MRGSIAGLIVANEEAENCALLRAELPVAGQTLMEAQARLLAGAGVSPIVVIAEQLTPALAAGAERLRREGLAIERARDAADAVARMGDGPALLLSDGLVTDMAALERLLAAPAPAIVTVPNQPEYGDHELIDPEARWAGLLLADAELLRGTAAMLGDWDLQSTLLRNAVRAGAVRLSLPAGEAAPLLAPVFDIEGAYLAERAISARAVRRPAGLADRWLFAPLARLAAPRAMQAMLDPQWFRGGSVAATTLAAGAFLLGWPATGLGLLLAAGPLDALGRHLAALGRRNRRDHRRWSLARIGLSAAALLALAWHLTRATGDGAPLVLALATLAFLAAGTTHQRWVARPADAPLWLAETDNLIWLLLPFALGGWWAAGLAAQAALAFASLLKLQHLTRPG